MREGGGKPRYTKVALSSCALIIDSRLGVSALGKTFTLISDALEDMLYSHHVKPGGSYVIANNGRHEPNFSLAAASTAS